MRGNVWVWEIRFHGLIKAQIPEVMISLCTWLTDKSALVFLLSPLNYLFISNSRPGKEWSYTETYSTENKKETVPRDCNAIIHTAHWWNSTVEKKRIQTEAKSKVRVNLCYRNRVVEHFATHLKSVPDKNRAVKVTPVNNYLPNFPQYGHLSTSAPLSYTDC